jgi:sugar phosphate isomerase/epimerase
VNRVDRRTVLAALAAAGLGRPGRGDRLGRIGIQLYTVRDLVRQDFEGTLAALREIGFEEVEFAGWPPGASAGEVRAMLQRTGLGAPAAHVGLDRVRDAWGPTLDFAAGAGHRWVVLPSLPAAERRTLDAYRALGGLLNRRGEEAQARGLGLAYHNHDYEFAPMEGAVPFDLLLERTAPALVAVELDLYWATRAGADPAAYFARWPGRFPLLHVKDMAADGGFTEVGQGRIDFARIFRRAGEAGTRHFLYEQDRTAGSPLASARASYRHLRALEF